MAWDQDSIKNVGTAGVGVSAYESGNKYRHTTRLHVAGVLPAITGGGAEAEGLLVYTFPAGAIIVESAWMSMGVSSVPGNASNNIEVGIGTVIATGAVALLSGTATFENILTGTAGHPAGAAIVLAAIPTAAVPLAIAAAAAHTVHFNVAGTWTNADPSADLAGTIILNWQHFA
jgi:hypothetical protein